VSERNLEILNRFEGYFTVCGFTLNVLHSSSTSAVRGTNYSIPTSKTGAGIGAARERERVTTP
jgi:hypothetical protein